MYIVAIETTRVTYEAVVMNNSQEEVIMGNRNDAFERRNTMANQYPHKTYVVLTIEPVAIKD